MNRIRQFLMMLVPNVHTEAPGTENDHRNHFQWPFLRWRGIRVGILTFLRSGNDEVHRLIRDLEALQLVA